MHDSNCILVVQYDGMSVDRSTIGSSTLYSVLLIGPSSITRPILQVDTLHYYYLLA